MDWVCARGKRTHAKREKTEILCCPKCGEVYLPEALVKGRMADVERELEDK